MRTQSLRLDLYPHRFAACHVSLLPLLRKWSPSLISGEMLGPGNSTEMCGGKNALSVFQVDDTFAVTPSGTDGRLKS